MPPPLAYLLTFSTYGTHLHGSEKGWADNHHSTYGNPIPLPDPNLEAYWRSRLNEPAFVLNHEARSLTLAALLSVCRHRQWFPFAAHVRTTHVHAVIGAPATVPPERMLSDLKAYATRALRSAAADPRRRYWTDHGSTRYL